MWKQNWKVVTILWSSKNVTFSFKYTWTQTEETALNKMLSDQTAKHCLSPKLEVSEMLNVQQPTTWNTHTHRQPLSLEAWIKSN